MQKILILGCNEVTDAVVANLSLTTHYTSEIILADIDKASCDEIRKKYSNAPVRITSARVDLNNEAGTKMMLSISQPEMIINLLPAENAIKAMNIALEIGLPYLDNSLFDWNNGELLSKQFELFGEFRSRHLPAVAGCSFNPAMITTLVRVAANKRFDSVKSADIVEINLNENKGASDIKTLLESRDIKAKTTNALMISDGVKKEVPPLSMKFKREFPEVGVRTVYLLNNPIVDDFSKEISDIPNVRYFSTYKRKSTALLSTLEKIGMLSTTPIDIQGVKIAPIDFLSKVMPVSSEDESLKGKSAVAIILSGIKNGEDKTVMIYAYIDNDECRKKYGKDAKQHLDALTVLEGIKLMASGKWNKEGVFTACAYDPELMLDLMRKDGLKYDIIECKPVEVIDESEEDQDE